MILAMTIAYALAALLAIGSALQGRRLRKLHTPGGTTTQPAYLDGTGYHPAETVTYCRDCRSAFPCPTLSIYGIKK